MRPDDYDKDGEHLMDQRFAEGLNNLEVPPPTGVWENINSTLDADREAVKYNHWYIAVVGLLLPLTIINFFARYDEGTYNTLIGDENTAYVMADDSESPASNINISVLPGYDPTQQASNASSSDPTTLDEIIADATDLANSNEPITDNADDGVDYRGSSPPATTLLGYTDNGRAGRNGRKNGNRDNSIVHNALDRSLDQIKSADNSSLMADFSIASGLIETTSGDEELNPKRKYYANTLRKGVESKDNIIKGFYFGGDYSINSVRFIMSDALRSSLLTKDVAYGSDWGREYTLSAGYNFSSRFGMELEWVVSSLHTQPYLSNLGGKIIVAGDIQVTYTKLPLLFKYKFTKMSGLTKRPSSWNLIAGIQYSKMRSATYTMESELINNKIVDIPEGTIPEHELGFVLGVEYDLYINSNMFISLGARTSISTDASAFPLGLGRSEQPDLYNFIMGVNASFNFQMPKLRRAMK